jgi:hypothetical protein
MKLGALAAAAGMYHSAADGAFADTNVTGFAIDHRKVAPGTVFGAFPGARFNGEDFIAAAVAAGAIAVVARPEAKVEGAAHIADASPRRMFARLAAPFFAPVPEMLVAVTGNVNLAVAGKVNNEGVFVGTNATERVAGALTRDGKEAGYLFSKDVSAGTFRGVTLWGRK